MRTAESVVLTCCPPAPLDRITSIRRSESLIETSTSSASGMIATVAALVLHREWGVGYADLLAYATPGFFAFGLFSLPAGWLADSRCVAVGRPPLLGLRRGKIAGSGRLELVTNFRVAAG